MPGHWIRWPAAFLVVAVGPATRLIEKVQAFTKEYVAEFQLGVTSDTLDTESELVSLDQPVVPTRERLEQSLERFQGWQDQVPPIYSAVKVNGKRAYALARNDQQVALKPRRIHIAALQLLEFEYPRFQVKIECGSGTYIRSLGRDIAESMQSAAVMTSLVRTRIGPFIQSESLKVSELNEGALHSHLQSPSVLFSGRDRIVVDDVEIPKLANGGLLAADPDCQAEELIATDHQDRIVAVLARSKSGDWKPKINFAGYFR